MFLASPVTQANTPLVCNMHTITGDDDGSFQMLLPFYLKLGPTEYDKVYYSTNATVIFGQPDGTFWDYPQTPSVSVAGKDWVSFGEGAYTSYGYNENSFCIEWSVRPFPQSTGPLTQMRLVVNKFSNGNWHGEITTMTDLPADARRGIRFERGQPIVTMEAAFDVGDGGIPVEVTPAPTPSSFTEPPIVPSETPTPTLEPSPTASPEPQPSESPTPTIEPSPQPSEPSPQPSETSEPTLEPSPTPTPSLSPSESPLPPVEPLPTQDPTLEPEPSSPEPLAPNPDESPSPDPDQTSILPSDNNITETTDEEINTLVEYFSQSGSISDAETQQLINNFLNDGFISEDEVSGLSDSLTEDGILTEDEKELLVDVILEQADGNAISSELIDELGLDYEDLPDDQPVMLDNGVILFAEVADALEIFENPSEILGAVFTDPGKVLTAVANIGADMTPEKREESQRVVVASVIAAQILSASSVIGRMK